MILRKPYAFFIKHFKLFNIILTVLNIYVIYKLGFLLQFFLEYANNPVGAVGQNLVNTLLNPPIFIVEIIIVIFSIILLGILSLKKKPVKLYLFSILINVLILILLFISYSVLSTIEVKVIENKLAYGMRDFFAIASILELVITIMTCVRAVGFDIKSFSFGKDLEQLDIDVTDNEEFELQIDVDASKLQRNINRNKRYLKYFIYEHKFMIILVSTILVAVISFFVYSKMGIYSNMIKSNKMVSVDNFVMGTLDSYLTTKDYQGKTITDDTVLVAVQIRIKKEISKEMLNVSRFKLVVNGNNYYHVTNYKDKLLDFGTTYTNQVITTDFVDYLLVFEIPKKDMNKGKYLQYTTSEDKILKFKINSESIDEISNTINNNLSEMVNFNNSLINKGVLVINNIEIDDKFRVDYKFCLTDNECYDSYEYIVPDFRNNYDKTILKIDGYVSLEESSVKVSDLYDFINKYGSLIYTIDNQTKKQNISFVQVKPSKTNLKGTYYIEVLDEVKNATNISLEFNLRNSKYVYKLK